MSVQQRALVMAGGTGGHVYPALAVAHLLRDNGWQVDWVGTRRGLEHRVVPENGFALHTLPVRGLRGKGLVDRVAGAFRLLASVLAAMSLVFRLKPAVVLGMGGYVAGPAGVAAWLLRRPIVLHEQNAVAGTTNRMLAPLATRILRGLPGTFEGDPKAHLVGNPVRADIVLAGASPKEFPVNFDAQRPLRLLVLGGSLGSQPINRAIPEALAALTTNSRESLQIVHQCGQQHLSATRDAYASLALPSIEVLPFIEDMATAYRAADLVVCRAGALTVSELAATGTPAVLIPLPHAIDDHQTQNARTLSDAGAAELLVQADATASALSRLIDEYLASPERLADMANAARKAARLAATEAVVEQLQEVALDA